MSVDTRWTLLPFAHRSNGFASRLRSARGVATPAPKAAVLDWENEGGNLAPPPVPIDSGPTTGRA
jgi:hypothetical protein